MHTGRSYALALGIAGLVACGQDPSAGGVDAGHDATSSVDAAPPLADANVPPADAATPPDAAATPDAAPPPDAVPPAPDAVPPAPDATPPGVISGGPCLSDAPGATAYRVRWQNGGGTAYPGYEVNGLPDTTRDHTGAYGYTIPFTPSYVDTFLAEGGLLLNSSSFVDIEISTVGLTAIDSATLAIYGRSYNTTTSGSFDWQTFDGVGAAPTNLVSNAAPYAWYAADMTSEISPGDDGVLLRIRAGPASNALAVHRIELCMEAR